MSGNINGLQNGSITLAGPRIYVLNMEKKLVDGRPPSNVNEHLHVNMGRTTGVTASSDLDVHGFYNDSKSRGVNYLRVICGGYQL